MRHFIPRTLAVSTIASALLLFGGCSTPQTRISERPEVYQRLSSTDQALVAQGRIREGMSQDAVYIAWGAPNQRAVGRNRGSAVETWIYFDTAAGDYYPSPFLYGPYAGFGYGYGFGGGFGYRGLGYGGGFGYGGRGYRHHRRGGYGGFYYDPFFDPFFYNRTSVVSYPERTVSFQSGRVIAYQYLPAPRFY